MSKPPFLFLNRHIPLSHSMANWHGFYFFYVFFRLPDLQFPFDGV